MELWEIRVEIPAGSADGTELSMLESGSGGWTLYEDGASGRAWIVGIFGSKAEAGSRWRELRPALPAAPLGECSPRRRADENWARSHRAHFKAWEFGRLHWVPVWERGAFRLPDGHSVLVLDPGCGSGILALSAARLGFLNVIGFDCDPEAVRVSRRNARLNGLSGRVRFSAADLADGLRGAKSGIVLANIQADVLVRHSRELAAAVAPGGLLEMSGILAAEVGVVRRAFADSAPGWPFDSRSLGEWCDACLRRPAPALRHEKRSGVVRVRNSSM